MSLTRIDFQQLADLRVMEAGILLTNGMWDGAYYLAGYAVECGMKACILAYVERTGVIFMDKKYSEKCWTHDIEDLVLLAGLQATLDADCRVDPLLERHWLTAKDWNETRRYTRTPEVDARNLYDALVDPSHGVLAWIRKHW